MSALRRKRLKSGIASLISVTCGTRWETGLTDRLRVDPALLAFWHFRGLVLFAFVEFRVDAPVVDQFVVRSRLRDTAVF